MNLDDSRLIRFCPDLVIDATELGDLLPLCGAEHVVGAETVAQTGEPQAQPVQAMPHCVQSFTYTFACERRSEGEVHTIPRPEKYEHYRATQPYSLRIEVHGGEIYGETSGWLDYQLYDTMPGTKGGLWTYRRLLDRATFAGHVEHDLTLFNWPGNDYRDRSLLESTALDAARALQDAKRVSLGFLHWLQTEAPASGRRLGAPEIRLRPDVMGSADGLCKFPYIRESRRIQAKKTIVEQEVSAKHQSGPRAAHFADSVGVGWYPIDIHRSGPDDVGASCRTKPFQIPLGALLPVRIINLIAGAKNIGTTHITNGCYRLHPIEWNIGEAAGSLAAFALEERVAPAEVRERGELLMRFQRRLLEAGVPLAWLSTSAWTTRSSFPPSSLSCAATSRRAMICCFTAAQEHAHDTGTSPGHRAQGADAGAARVLLRARLSVPGTDHRRRLAFKAACGNRRDGSAQPRGDQSRCDLRPRTAPHACCTEAAPGIEPSRTPPGVLGLLPELGRCPTSSPTWSVPTSSSTTPSSTSSGRKAAKK